MACGDHTQLKLDKVFNDPIHGHIEIPYICVRIIDTPQFQRLRLIKQLGELYHVFPGAAHNRFEHCIGVCYLAGCMARKLQREAASDTKRGIVITDVDVLCVQIAGLCHDLGHGPFSHSFDNFLEMYGNKNKIQSTQWKHETASVKMFDFLMSENKLRTHFMDYGFKECDFNFIKDLIHPSMTDVRLVTGRDDNKSFLYDIVANKQNGVDVDKFDYFARDCYHLGLRNSFDHGRLIKFTRILKADGRFQICYREKEILNLYDMFHTRDMLHRRAYQHSVSKAIQAMICEIMVYANDHIKFKGKDNRDMTMYDAATEYDMKAFYKTNDYIIQRILDSDIENDDIAAAKELILRIQTRKLYQCVYTCRPKQTGDLSVDSFKEQLYNLVDLRSSGGSLTKSDVTVVHVKLNYGQEDKDPINNIRFYNKMAPDTPVKSNSDEVSLMAVPARFSETFYSVYSKTGDADHINAIRNLCLELENTQQITPIKTGGLRCADRMPERDYGDRDRASRNIKFAEDTV